MPLSAQRVFETLVVRVVSDTHRYTRGIHAAQNTTDSFVDRVSRMGMYLTTRVTLPLAALGAAAVRQFSMFDKAMTESLAIMQNVTPKLREDMESLVLDLSSKTITAPRELAESYYYLASAGLKAEEAMSALPLVNNFAIAGSFDMAEATDLLTDAQSALGKTIRNNAKLNSAEMMRLSDILVGANQLANASVRQFSKSLTTKAAAAMKLFNMRTEEGVAVLAAYADQGVKAETAGSSFDRMLRLLAKSVNEHGRAQKAMGFAVHDADGNLRNMADIVQNLTDILDGMSDSQKTATLTALGFQARSQQVITPLIGMADAIRNYEKELTRMSNTTKEVADKNMESFSGQMTIFLNKIKQMSIGIGEQLIPYIKQLGGWLEYITNWWNTLSDSTRGWIVSIGLIAGVTWPALIALSSLATVLAAIHAVAGGAVLLLLGTLAEVAVPVIAVTAFAAGLLKSVTYLTGMDEAWHKVNASISRAVQLHQQLIRLEAGRNNKAIVNLNAMRDGDEKNTAIQTAIKQAESKLNSLMGQESEAGAQYAKTNTYWHHFLTGENTVAKVQLDVLKKRIEDTREYLATLKSMVGGPASQNDKGLLQRMQEAGIKVTANDSPQQFMEAVKEYERIQKNNDKDARNSLPGWMSTLQTVATNAMGNADLVGKSLLSALRNKGQGVAYNKLEDQPVWKAAMAKMGKGQKPVLADENGYTALGEMLMERGAYKGSTEDMHVMDEKLRDGFLRADKAAREREGRLSQGMRNNSAFKELMARNSKKGDHANLDPNSRRYSGGLWDTGSLENTITGWMKEMGVDTSEVFYDQEGMLALADKFDAKMKEREAKRAEMGAAKGNNPLSALTQIGIGMANSAVYDFGLLTGSLDQGKAQIDEWSDWFDQKMEDFEKKQEQNAKNFLSAQEARKSAAEKLKKEAMATARENANNVLGASIDVSTKGFGSMMDDFALRRSKQLQFDEASQNQAQIDKDLAEKEKAEWEKLTAKEQQLVLEKIAENTKAAADAKPFILKPAGIGGG